MHRARDLSNLTPSVKVKGGKCDSQQFGMPSGNLYVQVAPKGGKNHWEIQWDPQGEGMERKG